MLRNKRFYLSVLLLTSVFVLGFASLCMASSGAIAQPEGHTPVIPNWYAIGWTAVNFLILLALLYKFAYNPINAMLEQRTTTIESSLKHAEEVKMILIIMTTLKPSLCLWTDGRRSNSNVSLL